VYAAGVQSNASEVFTVENEKFHVRGVTKSEQFSRRPPILHGDASKPKTGRR
jgi:hypothetical protein